MLEDPDFTNPEADATLPEADAKVSEPIVVIQYRDRIFPSLLVPPTLILIMASFIVFYRVQTPDWQGLAALRRARLAPLAAGPSVQESPKPAPVPIVVVERSNTLSPLNPSSARAPVAVKERAAPQPKTEQLPLVAVSDPSIPPTERDKVPVQARVEGLVEEASQQADSRDGTAAPAEAIAEKATRPVPAIGFDPPGSAGSDEDTRKALDDIQREADENKAKFQDLEARKPEWLDQDMRDSPQRRAEMIARARRMAEEDRPQFREDLKQILQHRGAEAGPEIEALCDQYGKETVPEIEAVGSKALSGPAARLPKLERVSCSGRLAFPKPGS